MSEAFDRHLIRYGMSFVGRLIVKARAGGISAVWRVAPLLTTTEDEIDRGLSIMDDAIRSVLNG